MLVGLNVGLFQGAWALSDSNKINRPMIRIGMDLSKAFLPVWTDDYRAWVFQFDRAVGKNVYAVLDAGWGQSNTQTKTLQYTSSNWYCAAGVEKTFFEQLFPGDLDNASIGLRYGFAPVYRGAATFTIQDPIWGNTLGQVMEKRLVAQWLELTGGFRMEIAPRVFMGWTVRAKTLVNPNTVRELPPLYLVGFGRGEKNPAFDYNLYLMLGIGKRTK